MATQWELWIDGTLCPLQPGQYTEHRWQPQWAVLLPVDDNGKYSQQARPIGLFRHKDNPSIGSEDDLIEIAQRHARQLLWHPTPIEAVVLTDGLVMDTTILEGKYSDSEIRLILTGQLEERFVFAKETPVISSSALRRNKVTFNALPQSWLQKWFGNVNESLGNLPVKTVSIGMLLLHNLSRTQFSTTQGYCLLLNNTVLWIGKGQGSDWELLHQTILPDSRKNEAFYQACLPPPGAGFSASDTISVMSLNPRHTTRDLGAMLQQHLSPTAVRPWQTTSHQQKIELREEELTRFIQTISQNANHSKADIPPHCQFTVYKDPSRTHTYTRLLGSRLVILWLTIICALLAFGTILHARTKALQDYVNQAHHSASLSRCSIAQHHNQWLNNVAQPLLLLTQSSKSNGLLSEFTLLFNDATHNELTLNTAPSDAPVSESRCKQLRTVIQQYLPKPFMVKPSTSAQLTSCRYTLSSTRQLKAEVNNP